MPLRKGGSQKVISKNISKLRKEGYPPKKAMAMSMQKVGKAPKMMRKGKR